jgi:sec-independent protein translocase protein TatA
MAGIFLLSAPGPFEIILIVVILLLLFGGRKIPELMRGLGQGLKEFKKATHDDAPEEKKDNAIDSDKK